MIGPREELEMFTALSRTQFHQPELFQLTLAQLLCKSRRQQLEFPELFNEFWQELFVSFDAKLKPLKRKSNEKSQPLSSRLTELKNWLYNSQPSSVEETAFYSRGGGSPGHDLAHYHSRNIRDLVKIVDQIANNWASRPGRRKVKSKSKGQIDLRQIVRRNLSKGEMIDLSFRENKTQKPRLVLVCDVSKSMEVFSNFTVQLLYTFQNRYRSIETFVFGTELYRITGILRHRNFKQALSKLSDQVPDWSGGTRIGYCLDRLIQDYGSKLLHGKVIFLIISDGWDTGDLDLLETSMKYINRRVKKLIWLNPHASKPGFKPQVQGMVTALPYIDYLHGVHNVDSLRDLRFKV